MIPNAPILATSSVLIAAPREKVWNTLVDVQRWENWHPYLKNAKLIGQFAPGAQLSYGGMIKHHLTAGKMVPYRTIVLYGTMAGYKGITRWDLREVEQNQTHITVTESSSGFMIGILYSNAKLEVHLQKWLMALKAETES